MIPYGLDVSPALIAMYTNTMTTLVSNEKLWFFHRQNAILAAIATSERSTQ
jgi:hypothetical protein